MVKFIINLKTKERTKHILEEIKTFLNYNNFLLLLSADLIVN